MPEFLLLRLEAPLQAWGDVALDPRRPTRAFPSRSALAGLLANALGWQHMDGDRITGLQDALRYAVREDRAPRPLTDYQTADLGRIGKTGWTRWGTEERGGSAAEGTQLLRKHYLADASFLVALRLADRAGSSIDELEAVLRRPARPLFLGRKSCPPALPLLEHPSCRMSADDPYTALAHAPVPERLRGRTARRGATAGERSASEANELRCWYAPGEGPDYQPVQLQEVWDRRDFTANRFSGSRRLVEGRVSPPTAPAASSQAGGK